MGLLLPHTLVVTEKGSHLLLLAGQQLQRELFEALFKETDFLQVDVEGLEGQYFQEPVSPGEAVKTTDPVGSPLSGVDHIGLEVDLEGLEDLG